MAEQSDDHRDLFVLFLLRHARCALTRLFQRLSFEQQQAGDDRADVMQIPVDLRERLSEEVERLFQRQDAGVGQLQRMASAGNSSSQFLIGTE